jgi:hypothetical protein
MPKGWRAGVDKGASVAISEGLLSMYVAESKVPKSSAVVDLVTGVSIATSEYLYCVL